MMVFSLQYCWVLTFLVLQMWDIGRDCQTNGYTITTPSQVTAQVGLCVYIPCKFTIPSYIPIYPSDNGFWYKDNPKEVVASTINPSRPMFFTGNIWVNDCSVLMNDVQKMDENSYYFRFEGSVWYSYLTTRPSLTVTDLTDKPEISVGTLVAGTEATLTCRSPGMCAGRAPDFTWTGKNGVSSSYHNTYSNRTSIYFSNFTFTPSRNDNGVTMECTVSFLSNTATTRQAIKLNVEYPPDVNITYKGGARDNTFIVKEGGSEQMNCTVDSNPTAEITWIVGDETKEARTGQWLVYNLTNISLNDAGKYLCAGKNHLGSADGIINVIVHYAPRTPNIICETTEDCSIGEERMVYIMEDSTLTLVCTAESLPEASLSWIPPDPNTKYITVQGHLSFNKVALTDEGQFTCVASNNYGMSNSSIIIKVTSQPRDNTGIIVGVSCVGVIVLLLIGSFLVVHYFRKKKLSKKSEDKKEIDADDSSVVYANSEVHIYGNQSEEIGSNSVYSEPENNNSSVYMNVDDIHYATIDFSKQKPTNAQKNIEIEYAEIKK